MNFILWNFRTCSRLKSGDGINMRTNPKAKEVTQSAVIIILLALKLANILSFYHDFFLCLDWFLDLLDLLDWLFCFLFFKDGFKCNYVVKAAVKWVILLIGYSVFLKHKYIVGRWLCRILFKHNFFLFLCRNLLFIHDFSYFCVEIFSSYMIFLTFGEK